MLKSIFFAVIIFSIAIEFNAQEYHTDYDKNWPQWRGPNENGYASIGNPPVEWDETKNVKWKIEIPGRGHSTPIVWEDQIILTSAIETEEKVAKENDNSDGPSTGRRMSGRVAESVMNFVVMAIDRNDGSVLWETIVCKEAPADGTHSTGSWASNSAVTDGAYIYAYFGSRGLYCMDFNGKIIWSRDFGQMEKKMSFGEGSSPVVYKDKIVVLWDHEGDSFLYILDKKTGKDMMKIARDEATSWSTPLIVNVKGTDQVITSATRQIRSYNIETGEIIWYGTGMTANVIPQPMVQGNMLYLMSGFRGNAIKAIDLVKAQGDIDNTDAIVWEYNQNASYTPSALLAKDKLYFLRSNNGSLTCVNAMDGTENYSLEKLEGTGTIFASPIGVKDRIYITSESGISYVVKQGANFEILAKNTLDDGNFASPVISGDNLFIRGFQYLYCISEK